MIKKYNDFILEKLNTSEFNRYYNLLMNSAITTNGKNDYSINGKDFFRTCRTEFHTKIRSLCEYYDEYYSHLARSNNDPNTDFEEMQKLMDRSGYTLDIIKKLYSNRISNLIEKDFSHSVGFLDSINGYVDLYLYTLNDKLNLNANVFLGGKGVHNDIKGENGEEREIDEYIMKYAYGYHKTSYGKLFLKQLGMTPEKFIDGVSARIKDYLQEKVGDYLKHCLRSIGINWNDFDISKYLTTEEDRFTIHYSEMYIDFKQEFKNTGRDDWYDEDKFDEDWIRSVVLQGTGLNNILKIDDVGGDLVIHE